MAGPLVGGLAVEIYSENLYLTKDIDMVDTSYQEPTVFRRAMAAIGFIKQGRVYINETTDICVEFPTAPLSVGDELIKEITVVNTPAGAIPILFATDVIKDRLAAYFHWQDRPSLVQALAVMINHAIDPAVLKDFCHREGKDDEYDLIRKLHQSSRRTFLDNHVADLVSVDFFTAPTATFQILTVFVILRHERREIVHFNVTAHPTARWADGPAVGRSISIRFRSTLFAA